MMNCKSKITCDDAIEVLESNRPKSKYIVLNEAIDVSKEALSKQIPRKPIKGKEGNLACECGLVLQNKKVRKALYFCSNCGQRIDWND